MSAVVVLSCAALLMVCAMGWVKLADRALPTNEFGSLMVTLSSFGALVFLDLPVWVKVPMYILIMLSGRPRMRARYPDAAIQACGGILTLMLYAFVGVA